MCEINYGYVDTESIDEGLAKLSHEGPDIVNNKYLGFTAHMVSSHYSTLPFEHNTSQR